MKKSLNKLTVPELLIMLSAYFMPFAIGAVTYAIVEQYATYWITAYIVWFAGAYLAYAIVRKFGELIIKLAEKVIEDA